MFLIFLMEFIMAQRKVDIKMVEEDGTLISAVDFTVTDAFSPYEIWLHQPGNAKKSEAEYIAGLEAGRVKASTSVTLTEKEIIDGPDYVIKSFKREGTGNVEEGKSINFSYHVAMSDGSPMPEGLYIGIKMSKDGEGKGKVQSYDPPSGVFSMSLDEPGVWKLTLSVRSLLDKSEDIDFPLDELITVTPKPAAPDYVFTKFEHSPLGDVKSGERVFIDYWIGMTDGSEADVAEGGVLRAKCNGVPSGEPRQLPPSNSIRMQYLIDKPGDWELTITMDSLIPGNPPVKAVHTLKAI